LSALTVTVFFIGSIFTPWAVVWGGIPVAIAVTLWFWPKRAETVEHLAVEKRP
jgi:cytochrome c oxidase subunit 1